MEVLECGVAVPSHAAKLTSAALISEAAVDAIVLDADGATLPDKAVSELKRSARRLRVPVVDQEWAVNAIVSGQLPPELAAAAQRLAAEGNAPAAGGGLTQGELSPDVAPKRRRLSSLQAPAAASTPAPAAQQGGEVPVGPSCLPLDEFRDPKDVQMAGNNCDAGLQPLGGAQGRGKANRRASLQGRNRDSSAGGAAADAKAGAPAAGAPAPSCPPMAAEPSRTVHEGAAAAAGRTDDGSLAPRPPSTGAAPTSLTAPVQWIGEPLEPGAAGGAAARHRHHYAAVKIGPDVVRLGDCVELAPLPGEGSTRIVRVEKLWAERTSSSQVTSKQGRGGFCCFCL